MATFPKSGRYTITNVEYGHLAVLPDANGGSTLAARTEMNDPGEKWDVTLLSNKKYVLKNHGHMNFVGWEGLREWTIQESRVKGQYTISPTNADLFWGLADGDTDTPVTLAKAATDPKNQWIFTKAY